MLSENEIATYCRKKGLYVEELNDWRKQCLRANTTVLEDPERLKIELRDEKQKSKLLEKELRRKEKALAETAALLVLRKKAEAIWGDPEEE